MPKSGTKFRSSNLSDEEQADIRRLRQLFDQKASLSQKEFGSRWGIGSPGMMSQYLTGKRSLGLAAAIKFAKGLGVEVSNISPTLARQLSPVTASSSPAVSLNVTPLPAPHRTVDTLTELQALVDSLTPLLRDAGINVLHKWLDGQASATEAAAVLEQLQQISVGTTPAAENRAA